MLQIKSDPEENLRACIQEAYNYPDTSDQELRQIYASIPDGALSLFKVFEEETDPINIHVDFRFTGSGIKQNSITANALSEIISGISGATSELIKQDFPRSGKNDPVRVVALEPGSFVVSLEAASEEGLPTPLPTHESMALERVVKALFSDGSEPLLPKVKQKLKKTAIAFDQNDIQFEATIRQRRNPRRVFRYNADSFRSLVATLNEKTEESVTQTLIGKFDGFSISQETMSLLIHNVKTSIKVPGENFAEIISLFPGAEGELWLECEVIETTTIAANNQTSRVLVNFTQTTPESA